LLYSAASASCGERDLLDRLGDFRTGGLGVLVTLCGLSPQLREQGEFAMHNSDKTRAASLDFLEGRSAGSTERILEDTREALGGQSGDASGRLRELSASRRAFGNAEYDRLRDEGPDLRITKRAEEYLTQARVQAMWDEANQTGLIGMRPDLADLSMSKALDIRDQLTGAIGRAHRA